MTLFCRLLVSILVMREDEIASYLFCELSPYPISLFKNGILRDPKKKSKLRENLTKNVNQTELPGAAVHVFSGGALLHLVQWLSNTTYSGVIKQWLSNNTYSGVIKQYREYLLAAFGPCTVIFDSYDNGPSTKYIQHQVRGAKLSQIVTVDLNKKVNRSQEKFVKNGKNKMMLISFLRDNL